MQYNVLLVVTLSVFSLCAPAQVALTRCLRVIVFPASQRTVHSALMEYLAQCVQERIEPLPRAAASLGTFFWEVKLMTVFKK